MPSFGRELPGSLPPPDFVKAHLSLAKGQGQEANSAYSPAANCENVGDPGCAGWLSSLTSVKIKTLEKLNFIIHGTKSDVQIGQPLDPE